MEPSEVVSSMNEPNIAVLDIIPSVANAYIYCIFRMPSITLTTLRNLSRHDARFNNVSSNTRFHRKPASLQISFRLIVVARGGLLVNCRRSTIACFLDFQQDKHLQKIPVWNKEPFYSHHIHKQRDDFGTFTLR